MTSLIGIKQNTRVTAGIDEGQEEIITRNFQIINTNIITTVVSAKTSNITSYLSGGSTNIIKTIVVVGNFKLTLHTNLGTFILNKTNTPVTLTFDTTTGGWIDKTDTVRALPLDIKEVGKNITPGDANGESQQGTTCAVNIENNTIVIGAPTDTFMGSIWVFSKNSNGRWQQDGEKISPPALATVSSFGGSVALAHQFIVVGSPTYSSTGRVWLYERVSGAWTNTGILFASGTTGANQGTAVAINDSETIIVEGDPSASVSRGEIYIFEKSGSGSWIHMQTFTGAAIGDRLGSAADIKNNTIVAGAPGNTGYIRIYKKTASWQYTNQFPTIPGPADETGTRVAINSAENIVTALATTGHVRIITISPYVIEQKIAMSNFSLTLGVEYVGDVAMSRDADIIFAGNGSSNTVDVFKPLGTAWQRVPGLSGVISERPQEISAQGSSLASAANNLIVGAPKFDGDTGAVHIWSASNAAFEFSGTTLQGDDFTRAAQFGHSVAMSTDKQLAIVGGPTDGPGNRGSAWVYVRDGSNWKSYKKINGTTGDMYFGNSVAINGDGSSYVIGTYSDNVYFYKNDVLELTLYGPTEGSSLPAYFGYSVAMSEDGDHVAIGAPLQGGTIGAVWYYKKTASVWAKIAGPILGTGAVALTYLSAGYEYPPPHNTSNGLTISGDGLTIAAGAGNHAAGNGAVWVFYNGIEQAAALQGAATVGSQQGHSVSLSADGNTMAVGAPAYGVGGAVIIWTRAGAVWTEFTKITTPTSRKLGFAVSLSADGLVLVASEGITPAVADEGVWVFENIAGVWTERTSAPIVGQGTYPIEPLFGHSLDISGDGSIALIGEPGRQSTGLSSTSGGLYSLC